jgi:hypothetical protein
MTATSHESPTPQRAIVPARSIWRLISLGLLSIAALSASVAPRHQSNQFRSFEPLPKPQRVVGDFDGDGRDDAAVVQGDHGDRRISIQLSESSSPIRLDET